jgi:hypothetical protein
MLLVTAPPETNIGSLLLLVVVGIAIHRWVRYRRHRIQQAAQYRERCIEAGKLYYERTTNGRYDWDYRYGLLVYTQSRLEEDEQIWEKHIAKAEQELRDLPRLERFVP